MIRVACVILFLIYSVGGSSNDIAYGVFDNLWDQLKADETIKPDLKIVDDEKLVARYSPSSNIVYLGQKALDVCLETSEPQSAIAFLLGHELAHSIQDQIRKYNVETNFLKFDRQAKTRKALEENADLNGAFTAYLSGYNISSIISELITDLYESYGLMEKTLPGYPSYEERIQTASSLGEKLDKLIEVYQIGVHLLESSRFEMAIPFFEEVLIEYSGPEVYNNMAVAYASLALDLGGYNYEKFVYPFEIEYTTRLQKPNIKYDSKDINFELQIERSKMLKKAQGYLNGAIEDYPGYDKVRQNLICVLNMMGQYDKALSLIEKNSDQYVMLKAITLLNQDIDNKQAILDLKSLSNSGDKRISGLAALNLHRVDCEDVTTPYEDSTLPLLPLSELQNLDNRYLEVIGNDRDFFYKVSGTSDRTFYVGSDEGYIEISLK
jgi:tetratricopeptide (TPR) repeat protein